jgi:16S rRNA (guanine(1405)-N(7))-methyltransferase
MPTQEDIVHEVLKKKELSGIEHGFVKAVLEKELRRNPRLAQKLDALSARSSAYKLLIKSVRAVLRRNVGLYEHRPEHRTALLAELRQTAEPGRRAEIITHLLATHASTNERLPFYGTVFEKIFAIAGKPESVIDIGCGLNPLAFPYDDAKYIGVEIDRTLAGIVDEFFSITGRDGECRVVDAKAVEFIKKLPESDIAFVLKLLDLIDGNNHEKSEKLFTALPAKWVVASFPTLKISGRPMKSPRRLWFEKMLKRLKQEYKTFSIPNELFYVIRRYSKSSK